MLRWLLRRLFDPGVQQVYGRLLGYLRPHLMLVLGAFVAMMEMQKIDVAAIEAAVRSS